MYVFIFIYLYTKKDSEQRRPIRVSTYITKRISRLYIIMFFHIANKEINFTFTIAVGRYRFFSITNYKHFIIIVFSYCNKSYLYYILSIDMT